MPSVANCMLGTEPARSEGKSLIKPKRMAFLTHDNGSIHLTQHVNEARARPLKEAHLREHNCFSGSNVTHVNFASWLPVAEAMQKCSQTI